MPAFDMKVLAMLNMLRNMLARLKASLMAVSCCWCVIEAAYACMEDAAVACWRRLLAQELPLQVAILIIEDPDLLLDGLL